MSKCTQIAIVDTTTSTEYDFDYSKYRYIGFAFRNSAGSIYNLTIVPIDFFKTFNASVRYISDYTNPAGRFVMDSYYKDGKVVTQINNTTMNGVIYGI